MKKIVILSLITILLCGCNSKQEQTEQLTKLAHDYYMEYGSNLNVDEYIVTISDLKKANKDLKKKYDLKILDKCSGSSKATLIIKDRKIVNTKINLSC